MSGRDLFAEQAAPVEQAPAVAQTCGNCAEAVAWKHGLMTCYHLKPFEMLSPTRPCQFRPSRWRDDPVIANANFVAALPTLQLRRDALDNLERRDGKEIADKVRAAARVAYERRRQAEREMERAKK